MNFGFVIDNRSCIGCHACSTACKSENDVPLGVYRTWVKYTETGTFPDNRRHFQVTRCNHCSNPPCVRICPVTAMYQREDGIVDFDSRRCIGCKACLQACPYDAIHIDPETNTAAKCHYCAHRTDIGLEPACVVVCPEHAIIAGDLDDPHSEISKIVHNEKVTVRKPEQGTGPKLFYIEGGDIALHPTATERTPETFMWADVKPLHGENIRADPSHSTQGLPAAGPIQIGGRVSEHMVQVSYNAQHKVPWHWQVPAYLVTKGIAAGVALVFALALWMGMEPSAATGVFASATAVVFTLITTVLLVGDLEKPGRFLRIILTPQWKSWLTRGAFILIAFSLVVTGWMVIELGNLFGMVPDATLVAARPWILIAASPLAIGVAAYTAFLFGQAEGRDLWQSPLLPIHLVIQATMAGAVFLAASGNIFPISDVVAELARTVALWSIAIDLGVMILGELGMPHASEVAARAAHDITHGRYKNYFWIGSILVGHIAAFAVLYFGVPVLPALLALVGLYCYEHAFVMAPQDVPNS